MRTGVECVAATSNNSASWASRNTTRSSGPRGIGAVRDTSDARGVTALGSSHAPAGGLAACRPRRQPQPAWPVSRRRRFRGGMPRYRASVAPTRHARLRQGDARRPADARAAAATRWDQDSQPLRPTRRRLAPRFGPPIDLRQAAVEPRFPDRQDLKVQLLER